MEERLRYIFSNVNDWLKFAEAKHAVIIGLNAAAIWAAIRIPYDSKDTHIDTTIQFIFISILTISILISFFSYFPKTKIPFHWLWNQQNSHDTDNLLFYNDIKKYESYTYLQKLYDNAKKSKKEFSKLEIDYAAQIIYNSKIASYKYTLFKLCLILDLIAIFLIGAYTFLQNILS